jgi:hypothetical protein
VPLCAKAGDILVFDPTLLHTSGRNSSQKPRRLLNVGIAHATMRPLMAHWEIAGPLLQARASARVKSMLGTEIEPLDTSWAVVPEGWNSLASATSR